KKEQKKTNVKLIVLYQREEATSELEQLLLKGERRRKTKRCYDQLKLSDKLRQVRERGCWRRKRNRLFD
ncbi:unnamed protein product, partial [Brassica rapa]